MPQITVTALNGDIVLADPNPIEGAFVIALNSAGIASFTGPITSSQLERITPYLQDLESRVDSTGAPVMSWSVVQDSALDDRAEAGDLPGLPLLTRLIAAVNPAGVADLTLKGTNLLANQVKAAITIGTGAGRVVYTAVRPGAPSNAVRVRHVTSGLNTALSVGTSSADVTVHLATDGGGVATSTAADVIAAVAAHGTAKLLVLGTVPSAGTAQAGDYAHLEGGLGDGVTVTVAGTNCFVLSITDTDLHCVIPALGGVATSESVPVYLRSGGALTSITSVPYATNAGVASIDYAQLNARVAGERQLVATSGAHAVDLTKHTTRYDGNAAGDNITSAMADGTAPGQQHAFVLSKITGGKTAIISPTNFVDGAHVVLAAAGDGAVLEWSPADTKWFLAGYSGTTTIT